MKTVYDVLIQKVDEAIESHCRVLVDGCCIDFAAYKEMSGVIRGLNIARREIQDLARVQLEDEDD